MKKGVLILVFFSILLMLIGMYLRYSRLQIEKSFRAVSSSWLSAEQNNMVFIDAGNSYRDPLFLTQSFLMQWDGYGANKFRKHESMATKAMDGKIVYQMPEIPLNEENCADLELSWLNISSPLPFIDSEIIKKYRIASTKTYCTAFGVDDITGYRAARFSEGQYSPKSAFALYQISDFVPGKPNEVLLVDIKDGVPYQGEIVVEQLNAPPGTKPQIGQADASGVTSLNITLDDRADFRFTAGNDVLVVSFAPNRKSFHVEVDDYLMLDKQWVNNKQGNKMPHVRITPGGARTDFIIDYFYGYAWINRQIVPADKLNEEIELDPGFKIIRDDPVLVYAMIYPNTLDASESQVFPFVAKHYQSDKPYDVEAQWSVHTEADMEFSAIYQDYVKIQDLNRINLKKENFRSWYRYENLFSYVNIRKMYETPELQEEYGFSAEASVLKDLLLKDLSVEPNAENVPDTRHLRYSCLHGDECKQIRKLLFAKLARIYRPDFLEIANSREADTPGFTANKRAKMRRVAVLLSIWLAVGVVGFAASARRIRIRRQREYFENAARGKRQGVMPGSPLWMKAVIAALSFGLLMSVYLAISL